MLAPQIMVLNQLLCGEIFTCNKHLMLQYYLYICHSMVNVLSTPYNKSIK